MADEAPTGAPAPPDPAPEPPPTDGFRAPSTQEEFDRMIGPRLERERAKFAGYDDFRAKAEQFDDLQRENETELDRLRRENAEAAQRAEAMAWTAAETVIRASVFAEASKAGAVDPDAVYALIETNAVAIDDAGRVTGADTAVQQLLEAKPYLRATTSAPSFDGGARGDGTGNPGTVRQYSRDEIKDLPPERINELREKGHLNQLLGIT